ncbi:GNAT family N-acetyltransferase [Nostocoides sp. Soil756]|jgi:predicted GNAT family acetyltransferase|uniref:GNAT family N-acetyltransferase n=1 Tax=Nostocoides sp. Soil756 TaxID=1736399 RepID=UPI0009E9A6A4|nr:GNAT family N-acetyltransferase [Tetrasphaera sp. Soil756]
MATGGGVVVSDVEIVEDEHAWMARVDGHAAGELVWRESRDGSAVVLVHTQVAEGFEGQGVGGALVRAAVDRLAADGRAVRPDCPFARAWLQRHPDHPVTVLDRT